jgi:thiamine kinase-like enzyme
VGLTPERVLAAIPGWEGAPAVRLQRGLTNRAWRVEKDGRKAILKIDEQPRSEPFNTRPGEARIQTIAASHGLAAQVLFVGEQVLLTEYVEGEVWKDTHLEDRDNLERVARALRKLHALPLTGRTFDSIVAARRYVARIDNRDKKLVEHCRKVIEAQRLPHNLCCCHNDLVAANILTAPDVMFLDWEYACDNDPFFDLATLVEHHQLSGDLALCLLDAYFDGDGERWLPKLLEQQRLYLALYWLWLASRRDSTQDQLDAVAARISR